MSLDANSEAMLAEYNALRAEILQRLELRDQCLFFSLAAFGVLFGLGTEFDKILLLVAPLVYFPLVIYWSYQDITVLKIGFYIRKHIEPNFGRPTWEQHLSAERRERMKSISQPTLNDVLPYPKRRVIKRYFEFLSFLAVIGSTILAIMLWFDQDGNFSVASVVLLILGSLILPPFAYYNIRGRRMILEELSRDDSSTSSVQESHREGRQLRPLHALAALFVAILAVSAIVLAARTGSPLATSEQVEATEQRMPAAPGTGGNVVTAESVAMGAFPQEFWITPEMDGLFKGFPVQIEKEDLTFGDLRGAFWEACVYRPGGWEKREFWRSDKPRIGGWWIVYFTPDQPPGAMDRLPFDHVYAQHKDCPEGLTSIHPDELVRGLTEFEAERRNAEALQRLLEKE